MQRLSQLRPRAVSLSAMLVWVSTVSLQAQAPYMLKDVNPDPADPPASSTPAPLAALGNTLLFRACESDHGCEPWTSDGTTAGTLLLKDINTAADPNDDTPGSDPTEAVSLNGTTYFLATDGLSFGYQVWKTDGTAAGTVPALPQDHVTDLTAANGKLFFNASTQPGQYGLWASDGTPSGTVPLTPDTGHDVTAAIGTVLFTTTFDTELWKTDGTAQGTTLVKAIGGPFSLHDITAVGSLAFFGGHDGVHGDELWKSDGTFAGTVMVKDINPSGDSKPHSFAALGGVLVFAANDGQHGKELWRSDGTAAGTFLLADVAPGSFQSDPLVLGVLGTKVLFGAHDPALDRGLWATDGTIAGTSLIASGIGLEYFQEDPLPVLNGSLYFAAGGSIYPAVWKTDGTPAGTVMVKDVQPGVGGMLAVGSRIFLDVDDDVHGDELWKTDGTDAGTVLVKDIDAGGTDGQVAEIENVNGTAFFSAFEATHGTALWKSDGTPASTVLVKDIDPAHSYAALDSLTAASGTLFLAASDGVNGNELWKSDGTAAGTVLIKDIAPGTGSSYPGSLTDVDGTLFFSACDGLHGCELWKSDGTSAGTILLSDINPGTSGSFPEQLVAANGMVFFTADDGQSGREPWRSDGTAAGTILLKDIVAGSPTSFPSDLTPSNGKVYFFAGDTPGVELWQTDGTAAGTSAVTGFPPPGYYPSNLTNLNGTVFFTVEDDTHGTELWKSDGTAAGTVLVADINPGPGGSQPSSLTAVGGVLFFSAVDYPYGYELWRSDGTANGTLLVKDITPGNHDSSPTDLVDWNGTLAFTANDLATGRELWTSDGTAAGTVRVGDIRPGPAGSKPKTLTAVGSALLFTADDGEVGRELWAVSNLADLAISKTDGQTMLVPGKAVTYTIVATNAGPNPSAATVDDALPAALLNAQWACAAAAGATCTPSGVGSIHDNVSLPVGGTTTYSLSATVSSSATGNLTNTATVAPANGMADQAPANNTSTDSDTLTPQADLRVTKTDGQTHATPGTGISYTITASNDGPSDAPGSGIDDVFPSTITGVTWTCTAAGGASCGAPAGSGSVSDTPSLPAGSLVTYVASGTVDAGATGTLANTVLASVGAGVSELDASNNAATDVDNLTLASLSELVHATRTVRSLQAQPGPLETKDYFWVNQPARSSFEVLVDGSTGSISSGDGPGLDLLAGDATTVVVSSVPAAAGSARSLRFENAGSVPRSDELVRVQSNGCTTDCGPDALYRVRAWDTSYRLPRFNNSSSQVTVLLIRNNTSASVSGHVWFWGASGATLGSDAFSIVPHGLLVLNTSSVVPAGSGSATVSHDAPYGGLTGKSVSVEPATGFAFDTPLEPRRP